MHSSELNFAEMIDDDVETMFREMHTFETYEKNPSNKLEIDDANIIEIPPLVKSFDKLKILELTNCNLKNISNLPANLVCIDLSGNKLEQIYSAMFPPLVEECRLKCNTISILLLGEAHSIKKLDVSENNLDICVEFPPNVNVLNVNLSNIKTTEVFDNLKQLTELSIEMTDIKNIDNLSDNIAVLNACKLSLEEVKKLPEQLDTFFASSSDITKFDFATFPKKLKFVDLSDNLLQSVPLFPDSIIEIDLTRNNLQCIVLPTCFKKIDLRCNSNLKLDDNQKEFIGKMKSLHGSIVKLDLRFSATSGSMFCMGNSGQSNDPAVFAAMMFGDSYVCPKKSSLHIHHEHRYIV